LSDVAEFRDNSVTVVPFVAVLHYPLSTKFILSLSNVFLNCDELLSLEDALRIGLV
jgi:hypothetical protein